MVEYEKLNEYLMLLDKIACDEGLEYDVISAYNRFYDVHKARNGSYIPLLKSGGYEVGMRERYDWVLNRVASEIDFFIEKRKF